MNYYSHLAFNFIIGNAVGPVSYTHLDVYKRQMLKTLKDTGNSYASVTVFVTFWIVIFIA